MYFCSGKSLFNWNISKEINSYYHLEIRDVAKEVANYYIQFLNIHYKASDGMKKKYIVKYIYIKWGFYNQ